jgi:hypothetical protein
LKAIVANQPVEVNGDDPYFVRFYFSTETLNRWGGGPASAVSWNVEYGITALGGQEIRVSIDRIPSFLMFPNCTEGDAKAIRKLKGKEVVLRATVNDLKLTGTSPERVHIILEISHPSVNGLDKKAERF